MGFKDLFGFLGSSSPAASGPAVESAGPSWILVDGSSPEAIEATVIEHSTIAGHEQPGAVRVAVVQLEGTRYGLSFEPDLPPYSFANLVSWLEYRGAERAVGWLTAPGSRVRYFLRTIPGDDSIQGAGSDGTSVSVYLPDGVATRSSKAVTAETEPDMRRGSAIRTFEINVDFDRSFGNPDFDVQ